MRNVIVLPLVLLWSAFGAETVTRPFVGVTHTHRVETAPRAVSVHVVAVDLDAPGIGFRLTGPSGGRETVRQTTLEYLRETGAQVAVNAHFFEPYPSEDSEVFLIGLAVANGVRYSEFETPRQSYALVANAPALHIDRAGRASIIGPGHEGELWIAVAGSAQVVTGGVVTIPEYLDESHPGGVLQPGTYSNSKSWYAIPNARTLVGLTSDRRTLYVLTVDKSAGSEGLTVREAAAMLAGDYGVREALNLDGGGSTTLAMESPDGSAGAVVNAPSGGVRRVGSSLAVFARRAR